MSSTKTTKVVGDTEQVVNIGLAIVLTLVQNVR